MGEGKIIIAILNGKVITKVEQKELSQQDLGMLLANLELMRLEFLSKYKANLRRYNKDDKHIS